VNIQDKWNIIDHYLKDDIYKGGKEEIFLYWKDLEKWLHKKKFFGEFGYDFINKKFLKEPEDPAQQHLPFNDENKLEQARLQIDESLPKENYL
jgi:hypothetical protein